MKYAILLINLIFFLLLISPPVLAANQPTTCPGTPISFPNVQKLFVPLGEDYGRPGDCVIPRKVVMHTTASSMNALDTYNYFASGSEGRGVDAHFIIGADGKMLQTVELLDKTTEVAYAVAGYNQEAISIEMTYNGVFHDKVSVPPVQYTAAVTLVNQLMKQYDIPVSGLSYDWTSKFDEYNPVSGDGVFGHYQLNPTNRSDPGVGFFKEFLIDVAKNVDTSSKPSISANGSSDGQSPCVITKVGNPSVSPVLPPNCGGKTGDGSPRGQKPPNYPTDLASAIKEQFGITIEGFDNNSDYMKWIWEKLWDIKGTNFSSLVKGAIVKKVSGETSSQVGCPGKKNINGGDESVRLIAYPYGEAFFKYIFTHELGHVIRMCNDREKIRWNDTIIAGQSEGGVSYYGSNASSCIEGSKNEDEDFADMVAYYLNPDAGISTTSCDGKAPAAPPNPFFSTPVLKPFHFEIAKSILN